jgi:hypothetical protein
MGHRSARLILAGLLVLGASGVAEVSSSGEVSEVLVENTQGVRADRSSCDSAECTQASGAGGVGTPLE